MNLTDKAVLAKTNLAAKKRGAKTNLAAKKRGAKKPRVPEHTIFLGLYIDKQTSQALTRAAKAEKSSRSFVVRKLLTVILARYELEIAAQDSASTGAKS